MVRWLCGALVVLCIFLGAGCGGGSGAGSAGSPGMGTTASSLGTGIVPSITPAATPTPMATPTPTAGSHHFLFAINNNLTQFVQDTIDPASGLFSAVGSPVALPPFITQNPVGNNLIAFTPDGTMGFVANSATNDNSQPYPPAIVTVLNVAADGTFVTTAHPTFEQNKPTALAVDPTGQFLYTATDLNEPQLEVSTIANGTLSTNVRVGILPSLPIIGVATTAVGSTDVLVAIGATNPYGNDVASYIIRMTDGVLVDTAGNPTFPTGAASSFQMDAANGPPSQPTAMRIGTLGGTPFTWFGSDSGRIFVSTFNANGTLNPPTSPAGTAVTVGGAAVADLQVVSVGGTPILYVLSNGTSQQVQAFALNPDGSLGAQIGATASTGNAQAAISMAVDVADGDLYVGTQGQSNVAVFKLGADGSIGSATALNDGDASPSPGARSVTILTRP